MKKIKFLLIGFVVLTSSIVFSQNKKQQIVLNIRNLDVEKINENHFKIPDFAVNFPYSLYIEIEADTNSDIDYYFDENQNGKLNFKDN